MISAVADGTKRSHASRSRRAPRAGRSTRGGGAIDLLTPRHASPRQPVRLGEAAEVRAPQGRDHVSTIVEEFLPPSQKMFRAGARATLSGACSA